MESKQLRIVYMGTPDFAVMPLQRLVEEGYNIVGGSHNPPINRPDADSRYRSRP